MLIDNLKLLHQFQLLASDILVQIFLFLVLLDIVSGMAKGIAGKQGNSTKGLLGIVKHMLITILVLFAYPYMKLLHLDVLAISFIMFYILAYGISLTENWGQLGLPVPSFVKERLEKLKDLSDKGEWNIKIDVNKKEKK